MEKRINFLSRDKVPETLNVQEKHTTCVPDLSKKISEHEPLGPTQISFSGSSPIQFVTLVGTIA